MEYPEIVAAGIYDSALLAKEKEMSHGRRVSLFELELALEDGGTGYIDGNAVPITPETVICAKPGQMRRTRFPFRCYYIHMVLPEGELSSMLSECPSSFRTASAAVYRELFRRLLPAYDSLARHDSLLLHGLTLQLIHTLCTDPAARAETGRYRNHDRIAELAISYIKEHLTEDLSLESVARAVSLSPVYFHNTFKASVGKTLRDYVEEQRLRKAAGLLLATRYSLTKIAYECGFSSQSYFSFVFKRKMGVTPREYATLEGKKYEKS